MYAELEFTIDHSFFPTSSPFLPWAFLFCLSHTLCNRMRFHVFLVAVVGLPNQLSLPFPASHHIDTVGVNASNYFETIRNVSPKYSLPARYTKPDLTMPPIRSRHPENIPYHINTLKTHHPSIHHLLHKPSPSLPRRRWQPPLRRPLPNSYPTLHRLHQHLFVRLDLVGIQARQNQHASPNQD